MPNYVNAYRKKGANLIEQNRLNKMGILFERKLKKMNTIKTKELVIPRNIEIGQFRKNVLYCFSVLIVDILKINGLKSYDRSYD